MVLKLMLALVCFEHVFCYPGRLYPSIVWDSNLGQLVHRVRRETPTDVSGNPEELMASPGNQNPEQGVLDSNTEPGLSAESAGFHGNQHPIGNAQLSDKQADPAAVEGAMEMPADIPTDKLTEPQQDIPVDTAVDTHTASEQHPLTAAPAVTHVENLQDTASDPVHNALIKPQSSYNPQYTPKMGEGSDPSAQQEQAPTDVRESAHIAPRALPLKGHFPHHSQQAPTHEMPKALPQTGADPSRQRAPDARGKIWGRQFRPVALPQRQAPPARKGNQGKQGARQRPAPNWNKAQGQKKPGQQAPAQQAPPSPMPGMPPHPMFDYRYYNPYSYMYGRPPSGQAPSVPGGAPMPTGYPYPPYPPYSMGGDRPDMEGFGPGFGLDIRNMGRFPCMNMSDPICIQQRMMGGEMDIETPYGEMDIEPGYELDIEGPMAYGMLRSFGIGNFTDAHYPEITLNNHILAAMQKRFGVNTTAGIQRMSGNPEFQAFMYHILTHSSPVSLAEFNANLTKAEVDRIIANLDASPPNHRIPVSNLNHAQLNTQGASRNGASLTLDNNPATNLWSNLGAGTPFGPFPGQPPFGPFPGQPNPFFPPQTAPNVQAQTAPIPQRQMAPLPQHQKAPIAQRQTAPHVPGHTARLVQNPGGKGAAMPGRFEALVQRPHRGEGREGIGEAREATEHSEKKNRTANQEAKEKEQVKSQTGNKETNPIPASTITSPGAAKQVNPETQIISNTGKTDIHGAGDQVKANTGQSQPATSQSNQSQAPRSHIDQSQASVSQIDQAQAGQPQSGSKAPAKLAAAPSAAVSSNTKPTSMTKEQDIIGKEINKGLSKDHTTRTEKTNVMAQPNGAKVSKTSGTSTVVGSPVQNQGKPANTQTNSNGANSQGGRNTVVGSPVQNPINTQTNSNGANSQGGRNTVVGSPVQNPVNTQTNINGANIQGGRSDSIPIGIKEAGLVPSVMNNTVPVKAETGYTSTGFAIAAATIIALIIILGPIACMLCKMKEKRQQKMRKQKAHKNRDMSENNIMESMVLHDFGKSGANSVTNEKAKPYDYFRYGRDLGEIDRLSGNPESQRGRLP